ncbi:DUF3772 domain-containing protein [Magnetospira sp. QH-2]|uniref:DUF3772 domain-containing protein n=1 Tax=Magnetospira sp. (strain QH-2) TaxID=1288970 RepID=UPI0003E81BFF|nr:DUF3772 domain-containing protein [Magnetospira sp. QH-2]CCQ72860.1 putative Mechanosensitive ion channel family protein [Magnetospira sp. QH-2]
MIRWLLILGLCLAVMGTARAQNDVIDHGPKLQAWELELEDLAASITPRAFNESGVNPDRQKIRALIERAIDLRRDSQIRAKQVQDLLDQLGPKPEEGAPPEDAVIAERRAALTEDLTRFETETKQAGLLIAEGEQILRDLSRSEREVLRDTLFERGLSPLDPDVWSVAARDFSVVFRETFIDAPYAWWIEVRAESKKRTRTLQVLAYALLAALIGWPLRHWLKRRFGRDPSVAEPGASRRLLAAITEGITDGIIPMVFLAAIGILVVEGGLVEDALASAVVAVTRGVIIYLLAGSLIDAALAPEALQWRLLALREAAARLFVTRAKLSVILFLILDGSYRALTWVDPSEAFQAIHATLTALILAPVLVATLSGRIWGQYMEAVPDQEEETEAERSNGAPVLTRLRTLLSAALLAAPLVAFIGYGQLASYLMRLLVLSTIALGIVWFLRTMLREAGSALLEGDSRLGQGLRDALAISQDGAKRLKVWLFLIADLGLILLAFLLILPVWGLRPEQMLDMGGRMFRGLQIGSYTFSLADIFLGLVLFTGILLLTRLVQKSVTQHLLPNLTQDKGISDALKTGIGYLGVLIGLLVGISAMGIDLTNLALIAGALSVGIGFGLQTIVNNFVSGLILLAERPIKPGDWVVVGPHEGTVKKVNVRSTEITTFQRASVIIPNAELISTSVLNWTHKSLLGRMDIVVGVAYGSDVEQVREILMQCAREHANVMTYPLPFVLFMDFGDSALIFELRAYLRNVESRMSTASDIRFTIYARLNEAGIEIPFPQRVLHTAPNERDPAEASPTGSP